MAYLNIVGFETGDTGECVATGGTVSVQSSTKRTGTYALRVNPSATFGYARLGAFAASGVHQATGVTTGTLYGTLYFRVGGGNLTGTSFNIFEVGDSTGGFLHFAAALQIDSSNRLNWTPGGFISGPLTQGLWYRAEFFVQKSGASDIIVYRDDGVEFWNASGTAANINPDYLWLGSPTALVATKSFDCYYDDIALSNSALPGIGEVRMGVPRAAGTNSAWTNGTGSTFAVVDEIPPNDDTDYLMETGTTGSHGFLLTQAATVGISGTIRAVKAFARVRNVSVGAGSIALRWRDNGGGSVLETAYTTGGTSYVNLQRVRELSPKTGTPAWATTNWDTLEIEVVNNNANDARCTAIYAMVWCTGSTTHTAAVAVTATAALSPFGKVTYSAVVARSASATLAPFAKLELPGAAARAASGALAGVASVTLSGVLAVTGTGVISVVGTVDAGTSAAALSAAATLAALATIERRALTALAASGALSPNASLTRAAAAARVGTATMAAVAEAQRLASAALSGAGSLAARPALELPGASALSGAATLAPVGRGEFAGLLGVTGSASLSPAAVVETLIFAQLMGTGALAPLSVTEVPGAASLSAAALLTLAAITFQHRVRLKGAGFAAPGQLGGAVTVFKQPPAGIVAPVKLPGGHVRRGR